MYRCIAAISALLIAANPAFSQTSSTAEDRIRKQVRDGLDVKVVQKRVYDSFFRAAPAGSLTREMAVTLQQYSEAKKRLGTRSTLLRNDLDGNGEVSAQEVERIRKVLVGGDRESFENMLLDVDADQNGALSEAEIRARIEAKVAELRETGGHHRFQAGDLMEFDVDGDGTVVFEELKTSIKRIANEGLKDREVHLSKRSAAPDRRETASVCNLQEPSSEAQLVYIGGYRGTAVSSVAVSGLDEDTSFGTIEIEKGTEPLYILAAVNDSTVMQITGAIDRVERFVAGGHRGMGVVGLPESVVDFTPLRDCNVPIAYRPDSSKWIQAKALLTNAFGREVNMLSGYRVNRLAVPSGKSLQAEKMQTASGGLVIQTGNRRFRMTEEGLEEMEPLDTSSAYYRDLIRTYPDGVASVIPKDVVTNGKAEPYEVLPLQAGLAQLMQSGALSKLSDGALSIDKPIPRFPAGLTGGHSVRFVLRRGVPMPEGSPGHSSVLIEETGECVGSRC
ncbi:hypothetical protein [Roseibium sp.]|uniref:hypothetical protein n=1 Tax=Roseibium sp. TaxID=1936156 RepID=UPI003BAE80E6